MNLKTNGTYSLFILAALAFLFFMLSLSPGYIAAQTATYKEQSPTAKLGEVEIELFGPPDFQRVDGYDYDIDERLSLLHPKSSESLAIFAESSAWKPFFDEIFGNSPRDLAYYATITTAPATNEFESVDLNAEDISILLGLNEIDPEESPDNPGLAIGETAVSPLKVMGQTPRYITFETRLMEALPAENKQGISLNRRYLAVVSALEVEGQVLFLNVFANRRGPKAELVEELAVAWREAYLGRTKSLGSGG